jgi:hypothetical protein
MHPYSIGTEIFSFNSQSRMVITEVSEQLKMYVCKNEVSKNIAVDFKNCQRYES